MYQNLGKGTKPTLIPASESNASLIAKAKCVNISLGSTNEMIKNNADIILKKDLVGRNEFMEKTPEVNLPANLDTDLNLENFPSLVQQPKVLGSSPVKETEANLENSWVRRLAKVLRPLLL